MGNVNYNELLSELSKVDCEEYAVKHRWASDGCCMTRAYKDADNGTTNIKVASPGCNHNISTAEAKKSIFAVAYPYKLIIHKKGGTIYVIDMPKETFTFENPIEKDMELFEKHGLTAEPEVPLEED